MADPRCRARRGGSEREYSLFGLRDLWQRLVSGRRLSNVCFSNRTDVQVFSTLVGEPIESGTGSEAIHGVPVSVDAEVPTGTARIVSPPPHGGDAPG